MADDKKDKQDYWKKELTPEQLEVVKNKGTEAPFTGKLLHNTDKGMYKCIVCGTPLFSSDTKYDSGSGWPSFSDVVNKGNIDLIDDYSHGMYRIEAQCKTCGAHLGHLFDDSSTPSGKYYCINSCSLEFDKKV